jgi:4-hydroxy-3-methylbut-2-en-1-yl diphosphate reductase
MTDITVTIDPGSGFCFGVRRAIEKAEALLEEDKKLFCLGDIVHNQAEMKRLSEQGLVSLNRDSLGYLGSGHVLFRAHGEPPSSYRAIAGKNITLTDATCPIVQKLQEKIKRSWESLQDRNGQLVILGNPGHPEIIGLQGQTGGSAIIIKDAGNIAAIDPGRPVALFAQTTGDTEEFLRLAGNIRDAMRPHFKAGQEPLEIHNTICRQVSRRIPGIREFARSHDVIVFVGGRKSSNGKILFCHCLQANPASHYVSLASEVDRDWLKSARTAGVCGATSTPAWLMEEVAEKIRELAAGPDR